MATETTPESTPFVYKEADLSPLEEQRAFLQDKMLGIGSFATKHNIPILTALDDPFYTGQVARNLTFASEFIPGFGDVQGAREGEHMMKHGQPKLGAAMVGLSALPFVPITPIKKALERGLKASPTKVMRTNTGDQAVSDAYFSPASDSIKYYEALQEGSLRYETNAERQLLSNLDFPDPAKAYNVDEFIDSTVANSPPEIQTTVRNQLDEWVSPDFRGSKATTQELLDDIGTNKPTIQENYMADAENPVVSKYSEYMPNIPTDDPYPNALTALETVNPDRYTERSFSIYSPNQGKLFDDTRHARVGQGSLYRFSGFGDAPANTTNRIFTTRAGMYDIDGKKTYISGEGQSDIYGMGTSNKKALTTINEFHIIKENVIESMADAGNILEDLPKYLDNPYAIDVVDHQLGRVDSIIPENLPSSEVFLKSLDDAGYTLDDWTDLVEEHQNYIEKKTNTIQAQAMRDNASWGQITEQARDIAKDEADAKYFPLLDQLQGRPTENLPSNAPLLKEWFPLHMKTSLNDAVGQGADVIRFPINAESVAKQRGDPLVPGRAQPYNEMYTQELDGVRYSYTPEEGSENLGRIYKKRTDEGIQRIEAEYGIKLNPTEITDDNNNRFLEIVLTPELKEAFETIVFNRGGAVYKKPLMNLKY